MITNERPLQDRVFILQDEGVAEVGGLAIPETQKVKPATGVVKAVGPGWTATQTGVFVPTVVKVGDRVAYNPHACTPLEINGTEYVHIREIEILIIL